MHFICFWLLSASSSVSSDNSLFIHVLMAIKLFVLIVYTEGSSGNRWSRNSGESPRDKRCQVSGRCAIDPVANCDCHRDETISDRLGHCDAIDSNVEATV